MGCSSSALNKAGDSSRFRSVTSNECLSTTERNESCVAQPVPRTPGKESIFYGNIQREGLPPLEKPKASVVPTANGVISLREQPLAKEVAPGPTEKTQPLQGPEESEAPQPDSKEDTPGVEEKKKDVETVTEVQAINGNAQTELSEAKDGSSGTAGVRNSPRAGEDAENPPTVSVMKPLGTMENIQPLETDGELQSPGAMGKDERSQLLEAIPKENKSPEMLEGSQFVETVEEQQLQETVEKDEQPQLPEMIPKENKSPEILEGNQLVETGEEQQLRETVGKDEQSQLLETIPKENVTSEILDRSQLVQTPVVNDLLHKTSEGPGNTEQIQPERTVESMEHPEGITEMVANMEMSGKIHTNKADQHTEGETGEKMETEIENEKVSERAETKEEETGEAVDLSAATELGMATEG